MGIEDMLDCDEEQHFDFEDEDEKRDCFAGNPDIDDVEYARIEVGARLLVRDKFLAIVTEEPCCVDHPLWKVRYPGMKDTSRALLRLPEYFCPVTIDLLQYHDLQASSHCNDVGYARVIGWPRPIWISNCCDAAKCECAFPKGFNAWIVSYPK